MIRQASDAWLRIPGVMYEINSQGTIRHVVTKRIRQLSIGGSGYLLFSAWFPDIRRTNPVYPHMWVARLFLLPEEGKTQVNHKDGNKLNNDVRNLEYVTPSGNMQHAISHKLLHPCHGEKHPVHKLTEEDVINIRLRYKNGESQRRLAEEFGVAQQTVCSAVNYYTWKHTPN